MLHCAHVCTPSRKRFKRDIRIVWDSTSLCSGFGREGTTRPRLSASFQRACGETRNAVDASLGYRELISDAHRACSQPALLIMLGTSSGAVYPSARVSVPIGVVSARNHHYPRHVFRSSSMFRRSGSCVQAGVLTLFFLCVCLPFYALAICLDTPGDVNGTGTTDVLDVVCEVFGASYILI